MEEIHLGFGPGPPGFTDQRFQHPVDHERSGHGIRCRTPAARSEAGQCQADRHGRRGDGRERPRAQWRSERRLNGRDVYRADDGTLYAVNSQHGRFEQVNGKNGAHMGELSMLDLQPTKPADTSGRHALKLK
jgi:hypothetical protein